MSEEMRKPSYGTVVRVSTKVLEIYGQTPLRLDDQFGTTEVAQDIESYMSWSGLNDSNTETEVGF